MLVIPSFYSNVISSVDPTYLLKVQDVGIFIPAQICKLCRDGYVCDFEVDESRVEDSILFRNVKAQIERAKDILKILNRQRISVVVLHTEFRIPLWFEEWFRRLYAKLLSSLPELLSIADIETEHIVVEMHPGFNKLRCYSAWDSLCIDIRQHARIIAESVKELLEACPQNISCTFTIENRSGSPTRIQRYDNSIKISRFTSHKPQALATFYDVLRELRILNRKLKDVTKRIIVGATLDMPQHIKGRRHELPWNSEALLKIAENELNTLLNRLARIISSTSKDVQVPILRSIHVHWFKVRKDGKRGRAKVDTHTALTPDVFTRIYSKLATQLKSQLRRVVQEPMLIVLEALPGRGGQKQEIVNTLRYSIEMIKLLT